MANKTFCVLMVMLGVGTLTMSGCLYLLLWRDVKPAVRETHVRTQSNTKTILYWNQRMAELCFDLGLGLGRQPFEELGCPQKNCEIWEREREVEGEGGIVVDEFDAVLFLESLHDFLGVVTTGQPSSRHHRQRYVFMNIESPESFPLDLRDRAGFFNWTMSYRRDSDIYRPYGWIGRKEGPQFPDQTSPRWLPPTFENPSTPGFVANKSKQVVWFVSNCLTHSMREYYATELSEYIAVDIYGVCGENFCATQDCNKLLDKTYKFYLSFENSLCDDYVTEKFFRTMQHYVVPIVYGGADYAAIAPPHSYIDVRDYESPAHLAEYLLYLDRNPQEYAKYFWWKQHYTSNWNSIHSLCLLCAMLHDSSLPTSVYTDINAWWSHRTCHSAFDHFVTTRGSWAIRNNARFSNLLNNVY